MQNAQTETHTAVDTPPEPRWKALTGLQSTGGAIIIRVVGGGFVGWATDSSGDTDFSGRYQSATPVSDIRRNAVTMALAPIMLDACRALVQGRRQLGAQVPQQLAEAVDLAVEVLSEMERLS